MTSSSTLIGVITLSAVSKFMKGNILFQVSYLKTGRRTRTETKAGSQRCLNMVLSDLSSYLTIIRSANSLKSFNKLLQRSTVLLCPSDVGAPSHSGTVIIGWMFSLPTIWSSSMDIPIKARGLMETPTYLTEVHMFLQIVGEITSLMKFWKSPVNYGEIIIS